MKRFKLLKFLPAIFLLFVVFISPNAALAATDFGQAMLSSLAIDAGLSSRSLASIVGLILKIIISLFGMIALSISIYAGVLWMTSKGDPVKIQKSKKLMVSGLVGMLIILSSYAITSFIIGKLTGMFGGNSSGEINTGENPGVISGFGSGFNVVSTYPRNEMQNAKTCVRVSALFNREVLDSTVNDTTIFIRDEDNNKFFDPIKDKYFVNGKAASFYHNNHDFDKFKIYRATISNGATGVKSINGELLERAKTVWFKTSELPDLMPQVKRSFPANNDQGICRKAVIQFEFQEGADASNLAEMDPTSFNSANILIQECLGDLANIGNCTDLPSSEISSIYPKSDFTGLSISLKNSMKSNSVYKVILKSSNNNPTNNPTDGIANSCGKPLDGNKNLIANGTPADDYSLFFKTGETNDCEPIISAVVPNSGYYNDKFKVSGDYFGIFGEISIAGLPADDSCSNADTVNVLNVNDEESCYISWNNKEINVKVPFASVTGQLKVELTDTVKTVYKDDFNVLSPYISKLEPNKGPVGEFIRISGKNFGDDVDNVYFIAFDGTTTEVYAPKACEGVDTWKDNEIIIETPVLLKDYYAVVVARDGHFSNYLMYQITDGVPGPGLCAVVPNQASRGDSVDVVGIRLGDDSDTRDPNASLDFTGVKLVKAIDITKGNWKDDNIKLNVPAKAVNGYVKVTANNKESNPVYFNVLKSNEPGYPTIVDSIGCVLNSRSPSPYKDAIGACTNMMPEVRFDMNMDSNSFAGNFEIKKCEGKNVNCNLVVNGSINSAGGDRMIFIPSVSLDANVWYQATIKTGVLSAGGSGKNLKNPYIWNFKTRAEGDCKVDLINVLPKYKTINIGENGDLTSTASSSIDVCAAINDPSAYYNWTSNNDTKVSIQSSSVSEKGGIGTAIIFGNAETQSTIVEAQYRDTNIRSTSDIKVVDSGFPVIIDSFGCVTDSRSPSPYKSAIDACINMIPEVRFNIDISPAFVVGNFEIKRCAGNGIGCDIDVTGSATLIGSKRIGFVPSANFIPETWYQATVINNIKSLGTNKNLKQNYSWTFKTRAGGICDINMLNVFPTAKTMYVGTVEGLTANPASSLDKCAVLNSPGAFYNWTSEDNGLKVSLDNNGVNTIGIGSAAVTAIEQTPLTKVWAQFKNTSIRDNSDIKVLDDVRIVDSSGCESNTRSPSPYINNEEACTNMVLEARFNVEMDANSFINNFDLKKCNFDGSICIDSVSGAISSIGLTKNRIGFRPLVSLESNVWYEATIKNGVKSLTGKNLKNSYVWKFKTRTGGECKIDMINVDPSEITIDVNETGNLTATTSSTTDVCAFIYDSTAFYNWKSLNLNKVTIKSTSLDTNKAGNAVVFGREQTLLNDPTKVEAQYKTTNIRNTSNVNVNAHGIGSPCANSSECSLGLCCSGANICTDQLTSCPPRIPEISSCSAEDPINYSNVLSNPSPFREKTNVCKNSIINVLFDMDMKIDGSVNAINALNNINISECTGDFVSQTCSALYSPTKINTVGSKIITFVPNNGLESKFYKIVVKGNVRNSSNVDMGNDYSWMFTVGNDCKIDRIDGNPGMLSLQFPYDANDQIDSVLGSSAGKCLSIQAPTGSVFNWHTADSAKVGLCTNSTYSNCNNSDLSAQLINIKGKSATNNIDNLVDVAITLPSNGGKFYSRDNNPQTSFVNVTTCSDGFQNWNETSVDNGGICGGGVAVCGNNVIEATEQCDNGSINNGNDGICAIDCKTIGGEGYTCSNSNDCNTGLCCSNVNICTSQASSCPPRVPEISSCLAENSSLTNILTNPSPFKSKTNICPNVDIVVGLDLSVISDESNPAALNNLSNIILQNCGQTGSPCVTVPLIQSNLSVANNKELTISTGGLIQNNYYKVTLVKNIKSIDGMAMLANYSWTFKTRVGECKIDSVYGNPGSDSIHDRFNPNLQLRAIASSKDGLCLNIIPPSGSTYNWHTANLNKVGICTDDTYSSCNNSDFNTQLISIKGKSAVVNNLVDVALTLGGTGEVFYSKNNAIKTSLITVGTCSDGIKNGNESSIDKGGACDCNNDDIINAGEECDSTQLSGKSCSDFKDKNNVYYNSGELSCTTGCKYYIGFCAKCGNGIIETDAGETCDDSNTSDNDGCTYLCHIGNSEPKVNGVCGDVAKIYSTSIPTVDLCSTGVASVVSGVGPWTWTCAGSSGGTTAPCTARVEYCGNGIIDAGEMCDVGNSSPVFSTTGSMCDVIFGEDNYTQIAGAPVCLSGCIVDVSKSCVSTYKFNQACTSSSSKVTSLNNSFGSGDLSLFSKINGVSNWEIKDKALYYSGNDDSTIIYSVKVDADNYTIKGTFKPSSEEEFGIIFNKSKDGLNYYKIEINNKVVRLNKSGAYIGSVASITEDVSNKWYDFTLTYRTDITGTGSNIKFDISRNSKKSSDAAVGSGGFVTVINHPDGNRLDRGYFGVYTNENTGIYFDNLYLDYNDDLYEYNNSSYNFGFYYCKSGKSSLSTRNDNINTNDAACSGSQYKCIDRSCMNLCDTNSKGFSGVYVISNATTGTSDTSKAFLDSTGKPIMVMRVWNVPRMYKNASGIEGSYGPFINFIEWLKRMNIGGSYNFIKRGSFPDDYMIYNQGNSYYFWAPNINNVTGNGYINVYVLTYQEGGDKALFNEIVNNVRFTTNLE